MSDHLEVEDALKAPEDFDGKRRSSRSKAPAATVPTSAPMTKKDPKGSAKVKKVVALKKDPKAKPKAGKKKEVASDEDVSEDVVLQHHSLSLLLTPAYIKAGDKEESEQQLKAAVKASEKTAKYDNDFEDDEISDLDDEDDESEDEEDFDDKPKNKGKTPAAKAPIAIKKV